MKCADRYKPKHRTHYVECEKLAGHDASHAAYSNGQQITWRDHDKGRRGAPDLVSIERESLAILLELSHPHPAVLSEEEKQAIEDAQRVLGHALANGTPLKSAEQIIEERTRGVVLPRPSTLDVPRTKHEPKALEREPTVSETHDRDETQKGAATTADVEREKREAAKREEHARAMRDDDLPEAR